MKTAKLIGLLLILTGCTNNNTKIISTEKFQKEYENSKIAHSMRSYKLLDKQDGYICLLKKKMSLYNKSKWSEEQICSEIDKLSISLKKELGL